MFLLEQQGLLARRLSNLGEQYDFLVQQPDERKISQLQELYREVGRDLLRLLFFVEMNAIGLRKILKKFDKRFGYKFTDYYVKTRANHPYSQLRQVFKHVVSNEPNFDIYTNVCHYSTLICSCLSLICFTASFSLEIFWLTEIILSTGRHHQLTTKFSVQGIGAVVGAISRNLANLQDLQGHHGSYVSIYDQPAFSHPVYPQTTEVLF